MVDPRRSYVQSVKVFPENIGDVIEKAAHNGADLLVVDTSPNSAEDSLAIADRADLLIVPCAPSFIDLRALKRTEKVTVDKWGIALLTLAADSLIEVAEDQARKADVRAQAAEEQIGQQSCGGLP